MVEWEAFTGAGHTAHTGCCTNPSSSTGLLNGYRFWGWELQGITLNPPLVGALPRLPCMVPLSSPDAQACPPSCALSPGFPQSTPVPLQEALAPSMPPAGTPPPPYSCLPRWSHHAQLPPAQADFQDTPLSLRATRQGWNSKRRPEATQAHHLPTGSQDW